MKQSQKISTQTELEQLIERYFEGETSLQEEQVLRQSLANCQWQSETIDEARFTMGYFTAHKHERRRTGRVGATLRYAAIAASVAVLLTVGVGLLWQSRQAEDMCVAYVNGKAIHNQKEVITLMHGDLNEIGNATESLEEQLSSLGEAIEIEI